MGPLAGGLVGYAGTVVGGLVGGPVGALVGMQAQTFFQEGLTRAIQSIHDFPAQIHGLHMGGNYQDSQTAFTMRQRAAQDMSTSLFNARAYLGREALLMHQ